MSNMRRSTLTEGLSAWLFCKHILPVKSRRYFSLFSQVLSCHGAPGSRPKWEIDLPGASVIGSRMQLRITVKSSGNSVKLYFEAEHTYCNWITALQESASRRIEDQYDFGQRIGAGAFGQVVKGFDKCTFEQCAIKIIDKNMDDPSDDEYIKRELNCMRSISHPNVVQTLNIFDTRNRLYLVLEYMSGGSLKKVLANQDCFSEVQTKSIIKDILQGAAYLHDMNIVHRDLKLDNVLCTSEQFPFNVKIADFGLANFMSAMRASQAGLRSQVGSPYYIAPEVLRDERYGHLVDSWSIGVMMYIMLTKMYPFVGETLQETLEQVVLGQVSLDGPEWNRISNEAKQLLKGLLQEDVNERLSAQQALADPWFYTRTGQGEMKSGVMQRSGRLDGRRSYCSCACNRRS